MVCHKCGQGLFRYNGTGKILSDNSIYKPLVVNIFMCDNCRHVFLVDKSSKNPNRKPQFKGQIKPRVDTNTKEELEIYNKMWIDSGGVHGVMPIDYTNTTIAKAGSMKPIKIKQKSRVKRKKK